MQFDLKTPSEEQFKAAQRPIAWLLSAERLRDAAEIICRCEHPLEIAYLNAYAAAEREATAEAYSEGNDVGVVEIKAMPPNYPPAQLLYAFAIENVLKGIIVANTPNLIDASKIDNELATHDLVKLATRAQFTVHVQEQPVLESLSQLAVWAARYPVARTRRQHSSVASNPNSLLHYGAGHPVVKMFFERAHRELESKLPRRIGSRFESLVVMRQPGV